MLISEPSRSITTSQSSSIPERANFQQKAISVSNNINISYRDQSNVPQLSLTENVEYFEATYSADGLFEQTAAAPNANTGTAESQASTLTQNIQNSYLETIMRRVEYLLREFTQNQNRFSPSGLQQKPQQSENAVSHGSLNYVHRSVELSGSLRIEGHIGDPDAFSPENTADRILQFAMSFYSGGDRGEFVDMVKSAVMKGYQEARAALGGVLPSGADTTIELVMQGLDRFAAGNPVNYSV